MNRAELRTLASSFCEDPSITKFTTAKYNDALEQAQRQFTMDSKSLYKTASSTMVVGTAEYDLPTDYILDKLVMLNGVKLEPISRNSLAELYKSRRWDTLTGTPVNYISDPMEANKKLILFPIPDSDVDGTDLALTYYALPSAMSTDSASPFNSSALMGQFHIAVASYAAWLLLGYLSPTDALVAKRKDLIGTYTMKVNEAIQTFGDSPSEPMSLHPRDVRVR
jgi:hypothetical protein